MRYSIILLFFIFYTINTYSQVSDKAGNVYPTIEVDGLTWIAKNMKFETLNVSCPMKGGIVRCDVPERYYLFEEAKEVCKTLGSEWRLPSQEDWASLVYFFGEEKISYPILIGLGKSGFNATLSGYVDGFSTWDYKKNGYYWSSTINDEYGENHFLHKRPYVISFDSNERTVWRVPAVPNDMNKYYISVRCVKD